MARSSPSADSPSNAAPLAAAPPGAAPPDSEGLGTQAMFARLSDRLFGEAVSVPRVGRFAVRGVIGSGGMGRVYEAVDEDLDRRVALKLLHAGFDDDQRQRLRKEEQALARLNHPNVVHVYEVGEHEGAPFVAMEHVEGSTLAAWQRARARSWREIVAIYRQAAQGLAAAHEAGIVHRDFKPGNVIVGRDGRVRVVDFGLAKGTRARPGQDPSVDEVGASTDEAFAELLRTRTGTIVGTPAYMAPEQLMGRDSGPTADQFSFCVALFEALFGSLPFSGQTRSARLEEMLMGRVVRPDASTRCPRWLRAVVRRGLRPRPADRYPSLLVLLRAIDRAQWRRRASGIGLFAGVPVAGVLWASSPSMVETCAYEQSLAGVWDETREQEVEQAFAAVGHDDATARHAAVAAKLDVFSAQWQLARREACEADVGRDPEDAGPRARLRCLDLRRRELLSLTSLLAHADADVVTRAPLLVDALPDVTRCEDADAATSPGDEAAAMAVVEQQARLTEARLLRAAGRFDDAARLLEAVLGEAEARGQERIVAEARFEQGVTADRQGLHEDATQQLERAVALAIALPHQALLVDASLKLAQVELYPFRRIDAAARSLSLADRLVHALPPDPRRLAAWHRVRGMLATERSDPKAAIEEHEREVELLRPAATADPALLSEALTLLANATADVEELERALALYREVVELRTRAFGPAHPLLARARMNVAIVEDELGRPEVARVEYERALALLETVRDPGQHWADAASIRQGLAMVLAQVMPDDLTRPIALAQQAQALLRGNLEPADPARIDAGRTLCNLYAQAELSAEALACHREQESLHDSHELEDPIWDLRVNIAQGLLAQGHHDEARRYLRDAMPRIREELGAEDPRLVLPLAMVVQVEEAPGGDLERARDAMEEIRAQAEHEATVEVELADYVSQAIAHGAWRLALRLHAEGEHARERVLLDEATTRYARLGEAFAGPTQVAELERWRARRHPSR